MRDALDNPRQKGGRLSRTGIWAAAIGLVLIALSAGHKLGFLGWQMAFLALALGGLALFIALITAGIGLIRSKGTGGGAGRSATWAALVAGLLITIFNVNSVRSMGGPPIHDITTDFDDPPAFVAAVPVREAAGAANPPGYDAVENRALQAAAYPDVTTIELAVPVAQAFSRAEAAARAMGWEILATDAAEGRIEATATTGWIGFKDDVVIRIRPGGPGALVDVRSKSRVGKGDAGLNAKRIRAFRERLLAG